MSTQYVSPTGNNGNNGLTTGTPVLSVSTAIGRATTPGDEIILMDGTHIATTSITMNQSGNASNYITMRAQNPLQAKIIGSLTNNAVSIAANYIRILDLDIQARSNTAGTQAYNGINCDSRGVGAPWHHIEVRGCKVHDCPAGGIVFTQSDYVTIENNHTFCNGYTSPSQTSNISLYQAWEFDQAPGFHNIVRNNIVYGSFNRVFASGQTYTTDGNGIIIDDFDHTQNGSTRGPYTMSTLVERNTCANNGGRGIHVFECRNGYVVVRGNAIKDNVLDDELSGSANGHMSVYNSSNVDVEDNIIYASNASASKPRILVDSSSDNHTNVRVRRNKVDANANITFVALNTNGNLMTDTRVIA
jgi:hypothetical protein